MKLPSVTLYFKQGSSDKVYQAQIEASGSGYVVNFQYGRRGNTLRPGTKTKEPVDLTTAEDIYGKLVLSKTSQGYKSMGDGEEGDTPTYKVVNKEEIGYVPQLLNFIEEEEMECLLENPDYWAQEKKDGHRMLSVVSDSEVIAGNKRGLRKSISSIIESALLGLGSPFILDGESVGDTFYVFDCLAQGDTDIQGLCYSARLRALENICASASAPLQVIPTARTTEEKRALLNKLRAENAEGLVFKRHAANYTSGRPASGGDQLKFKFYVTATCRVLEGRNNKRSVGLEMLADGRNWTRVGNVTIPPNKEIPDPGFYVEIRYLYAYEGGSLIQPTFLGARNDCIEEDCHISQLKYKREETAAV